MMTTPHFLPEWSPVRAVILAWPYPHGDWQNNYAEVVACYGQILEALSAYTEVWLVLHPTITEQHWRSALDQTDVTIEWPRVQVHNDIDYDDTWVRDYGPLSLGLGLLSFTFNGWGGKYPAKKDNQVAALLAERHALFLKTVDFVCEGGGLESNGNVLLVNRECIVDELRNPGLDQEAVSQQLCASLGVERIVWLNNIVLTNDDTDGHIDTIARFVAADKVLYAGRNAQHRDAEVLERLHAQLSAHATREHWQLFELPTPTVFSQIDGRPLPATYANFLLVNQVVFVPVYGVDEDVQALAVIAQALPDYRLVPLRCEALLEQHGSLHCATMQVAYDGPIATTTTRRPNA